MMLFALLAFVLVVLVVAVASRESGAAVPPRQISKSAQEALADDESPAQLSLRDPMEALLQYGTPDDARRLADQGIDLSALGYRPPDAH